MRYCILGTAGHIDHGKSALVKALTGTDPDRLPEEQARGMTLVLGYAHFTLPAPNSGPPWHIGIVDVPGHERFIKTMVAGASGFDLAMLVVAADDGVMPQTREHVDILTLLGIRSGLIALSKIDLVDPSRTHDVRNELAACIEGTPLVNWPIIEYSVKSAVGLDDIRHTIAGLASALPQRVSEAVFRLAIDRFFTIHGRGVVVTGTVLSGEIAAGATLELLPPGLPCKVREVHSYGESVRAVGPGQRAALNLTGIDLGAIERGMELATPGFLSPARYVDATVHYVARREKPLLSHTRVRVCMGTAEELASLVLLNARSIAPGNSAPAQIRFDHPVVCTHGQRFIFRNENARLTLGGGVVVRPDSIRLRVDRPEILHDFIAASSSDPRIRVEQALRDAGFSHITSSRLSMQTGISPQAANAHREQLTHRGVLISLAMDVTGRKFEVHRDAVEAVERRVLAFVKRHHAAAPREPGVLRDRMVTWLDRRTRPGMGRAILARLEYSGMLVVKGPYVAHRDFSPALSSEDADLFEILVTEITAARFDPPAWLDLRAMAGLSLQRQKRLEDFARSDPRLVTVAPGLFVAAQVITDLKHAVAMLGATRRFKLAEVRDHLKLTRRVVQTLLEHLDRIGFTRRIGDERILLETAR